MPLTAATIVAPGTNRTGRLATALMTSTDGYAKGITHPLLNLETGGQNGWSPNLTEWVSNQAYVTRPLHCILLEAPEMFSKMPNSAKWIASLKALFELHAYAIEGFNAELKVATESHDVGGGGEKQFEVVNVTREASTPKFTFIEKYGRPIQTLLDYWIRYGLMDPETKFALMGSLAGTAPTDALASWYSATCIFIVPDPLHKTVDKAWLTTNMFPTSTGAITAKRDLKSGQEMLTLDIEFPGISQFGLGVNQFAQRILDGINTTNADPFMKTAFANGVSADVGTANGYMGGIATQGTASLNKLG